MLSARGVRGAWGPGPDDLVPLLAFAAAILLVYLTVAVLFLWTVWHALRKCRPHNRTMQPWQVWLNLIPCFNIVWQFVTVFRVADSLRNEFEDRGARTADDYGKAIGLAAVILNLVSGASGSFGDGLPGGNRLALPNVGGLIPSALGLGAFICFVVYWVKIARYSRRLDGRPGHDDRPRRDAGDDDR